MVFKRGLYWYVQFLDGRGKRARRATDATSKGQAEKLENELKVRAERQRLGLEPHDRNPDKHTVGTLVEWHLKKLEGTANGKRLGYTLRAHVIGSPFADTPIERVDSAAVKRFLDAFAGTKSKKTGHVPSAASVNNLRAYLSGAFTSARVEGLLLGDNPVEMTKKLEIEEPLPVTLPPEAVRALLDNAEPSWRLVISLAAYAGMRRSEIARLKWSDVDFARGVISVRKTKMKRARVVPIHPELGAILVEAKKTGGALIQRASFNHSAEVVRETLAAVGFALGDDATFKALRSTWASQWTALGGRQDVVDAVGWGAKGSVMKSNYLKYPDHLLHAEMAKLSWPTTSTGADVLPMPARGQA